MTSLVSNTGFKTAVETLTDPTFTQGHVEDLEISSFLQRQVRIHDYTFDYMATPLVQTFNPWADYFNTTAIKSKVENYAFLNCKLKIRVQITASPNLYGRFLLAYQPLPGFKQALPIPSVGADNLVCYSQMPHVWIDIAESQGGEMELPFFYHKNWLNLAALADFTAMGKMFLIPFTPIGSANATTGSFNVQIFASADDVHLSNTTQTATLQSSKGSWKTPGKKKKRIRRVGGGKANASDEYSDDGPISGPAGAVANVANQLANVPFLKPYAMATEMVASGIGNMARLFGFSKTPVLTEPMFVRNSPFGAMADTTTSETVDRLTIDAKQGVTIDPRTVGLPPVDELSIHSIVTRESYIDRFEWDYNASSGDKLWEAYVVPNYHTGGQTALYMTPMDWVSRMFGQWRGGIEYRFQIVASQFHRGVMRIQWDPNGTFLNTPQDVMEEVKTIDVDITECSDITICVDYVRSRAYLKTEGEYFQYFGLPAAIPDEYNGIVTVSVLNALTSLGGTDPVQVLVSVKACDDFEVGKPVHLNPLEHVVPESRPIFLESQAMTFGETTEGNAPEDGSEVISMVNADDAGHTAAIFLGEKIFSLRALLKRYNHNYRFKFQGDGITNQFATSIQSIVPRYPISSGTDPGGYTDEGGGKYRNYVHPTYFRYITSAFIGMRGGMRWKFNFVADQLADNFEVHRIHGGRTRNSIGDVHSYIDTLSNGAFMKANALDEPVLNGASGYALTNQNTQAGLIVDAPYYSQYRFVSANPANSVVGHSYDDTDTDSLLVSTFSASSTNAAKRSGLEGHCAVSEDFNCFFFLHTPVLHIY